MNEHSTHCDDSSGAEPASSAAFTAVTPAVTLLADTLHIRRLDVRDESVVSAAVATASRGEDMTGWTRRCLEVGARAISTTAPSAELTAIERRLQAATSRLEAGTARAVAQILRSVEEATAVDDGHVVVGVRSALTTLSDQVTTLLGSDGGAVGESVRKAVRDATSATNQEIQRALAGQSHALRSLLTDDADGPLGRLHRDINAAHSDLGDQMGAVRTALEVAEARRTLTRSTAAVKGLAYEDTALTVMEQVAYGLADQLTACGGTPGQLGQSKVGDAVIQVATRTARGADVRIVVEAKSAAGWHVERWRASLRTARQNRGAAAAIGLVSSRDLMPSGRLIHVIDPTTVLVALDPSEPDPDLLLAAYQVIRLQAVTTTLAATAPGVDVAAIGTHLDAAITALAGLDRIDKAAGTARRAIEDIAKAVGAVRDDVSAHVQRALTVIQTDGSTDSPQRAASVGQAPSLPQPASAPTSMPRSA
jgi:hypothetical protein